MSSTKSIVALVRTVVGSCLVALLGLPLFPVEAAEVTQPANAVPELSEPEVEIDAVGDVDGTNPAPQKALQDTIWIADWDFEPGGHCSAAGWTHVDNHILNDGANYWHIETGFTTASGMTGRSAAVGQHGNLCCADPDGYDNDWYQGIRLTYVGTATLSLDYIVDSEPSWDFLQIETDSLCLSYARVDFARIIFRSAAYYRRVEAAADSLNLNGEWNDVHLSNYGPGTHCVYIAFTSDGGYSPCDGNHVTTIGEASVVDNIVLVDASGTRTEDFEDGRLDIGTFLNMADSKPFGTWARLYRDISDNDFCTENRTCAWLWTDHTTPTLYNDPSMAFGPGGYVVKGWLDDIIVSPWVSLRTTPTAGATVLAFRRFPGNFFSSSRIVQSWAVRGKGTLSNPDCVSLWRPVFRWNSLSSFTWQSLLFDMTPEFDPAAGEIQVRFRTSDWQWIVGAAVGVYIPGPGPYVDRVRIGRRTLHGPVISQGTDSRSQGQDCFTSEISPIVTPAGEHFRPTIDRFGACAFSQGTELGIGWKSPNLITGDSVHVQVRGQRPGGGRVTSITWSGAIVAGPHAGKAPPPHTVDANGFFTFEADSCRAANGSAIADNFFVDLDDFYFRGGDVLLYFWAATDGGGGYASEPGGLSAPPASVPEAEAATRGLFEVSFLPQINWDPTYLARIRADAHGKLDPTASEVAASTQRNCILYVNNVNARRLSGDAQRTSFMYALDRLGYREAYDVYDHQGMGNTNNQLGGRATIEQCQGYHLIVYDNGNGAPGRPLLPDGSDINAEKIDQAGWFRRWLAQVPTSEARFASLWILGSNTVEEKSNNSLLFTDMGLQLLRLDQGMALNPDVAGVASFDFDQGLEQAPADFTSDRWVLNGGCPSIRNYDGIGNGGTAIQTHRYRKPATGELGPGAIVMNRDDAGNWNTIMMTFPFFDIRDHAGTPAAEPPELPFLSRILGAVLPVACLRSPTPSGTGVEEQVGIPPRTVLHPNVPNPFNPTTTIRFDLARNGKAALRIYDVAGRLVRILADAEMAAGRDHRVLWNGCDDQNRRIASGIYFCRLDAPDARLTRKLVVMK